MLLYPKCRSGSVKNCDPARNNTLLAFFILDRNLLLDVVLYPAQAVSLCRGFQKEKEKMNWNRKTKTLAITLTLLLVAAGAIAQVHHRRIRADESFMGPGFEHHMIGFFADYLDLTDAQQAQAKQILGKERPTAEPLIAQLAQTHQKMRTLEEASTFDEAAVRTLATKQAQTMTELIVQKARIKSELMALLTPDQKAKLVKFMDRRQSRMMRHFQQNDAPPVM
jgi:periplasmic protein CpxP/Spy